MTLYNRVLHKKDGIRKAASLPAPVLCLLVCHGIMSAVVLLMLASNIV